MRSAAPDAKRTGPRSFRIANNSYAGSRPESKIADVLGRPLIAEALEGAAADLDSKWHTWTPGLRCTAFEGFINKVVVEAWPQGMGRKTMAAATSARTFVDWKKGL